MMFLNPEYIQDYDDEKGVDCRTAVGDVAVFVIPCKLRVHTVAVVVTEDIEGANTPIISFDKRPVAGSDTGRGNGDTGYIPVDFAKAGQVFYKHPENIYLEPGEELVVKMAQTLTQDIEGGFSGHFRVFVNADPHGELFVNLINCTEV